MTEQYDEILLCEMCGEEIPENEAYMFTPEVPICCTECLEMWEEQEG